MSKLTTAELNRLGADAFVETFGGVYEKSPWVAERAWQDRPFESVEDLHESMVDAVRNASRERKVELLRAHPDLGARTEMTDTSEREQSSAGLDRLSQEQYEAFQRLNETYRERFGIPFIMAVAGESPDAIREEMEERLENSASAEFHTALEQVHRIAWLRLTELVAT